MRKIIFVLLTITLTLVIYSQIDSSVKTEKMINNNKEKLINSKFPVMAVQTLSKNKIELPTYTLGKPTIICLVFEQNAQPLVDTWTYPILEKYTNSEINYYEVPMITSGYKLVSGFIDNGMRSGVPKELHNNVATYYGSLTQYKADLMMSDKNSCYIFLVNKEGVISHIDESSANAQKLDVLFNKVTLLL
jgi:ATP10 protein